jgi:hypothetical protein
LARGGYFYGNPAALFGNQSFVICDEGTALLQIALHPGQRPIDNIATNVHAGNHSRFVAS